MVEGHIRLFRKFKKSSFYKDSIYVHVWIHLLLSANWSEKRIKLDGSDQFIDIKPGQFLTSRTKLSAELGINRSKLERILNALKSEQQIEQQTFSKYRVISICNWSEYQQNEQQNEPQVSSKRAASEQQVSTNNNNKNKKNKEESLKEESKSPSRSAPLIELPDFVSEDAWFGFIEMRKKIKKPATERAMVMLIKKLTMFHNTGHDVNAILDQSTVNSWQDLYEIKNTGPGYTNGNFRTSGSTAQIGRKTGIVEANGSGTDFLS